MTERPAKIPKYLFRLQAYKDPDFRNGSWHCLTYDPAEEVFRRWGALDIHKHSGNIYGIEAYPAVVIYAVLLADHEWHIGMATPKGYKPYVRLSFDQSIEAETGAEAIKRIELQAAKSDRDDAKCDLEEAAKKYTEAEERVAQFAQELEQLRRG